MSTYNVRFLSRNKKNINTFSLKKRAFTGALMWLPSHLELSQCCQDLQILSKLEIRHFSLDKITDISPHTHFMCLFRSDSKDASNKYPKHVSM